MKITTVNKNAIFVVYLMRHLLFILFLFGFNVSLFGSDETADSLKSYLQRSSTEQERYDYMMLLVSEYEHRMTDSAFKYANMAIKKAKQLGEIKYIEKSSYKLASLYKQAGDFGKAKELAIKGIEWSDSLSFDEGLGRGYALLGHCYALEKDYDKAIPAYKKSIIWLKRINDHKGLSYARIGLGNVLYYDDNIEGAEKEFKLASSILDSLGDSSDKAGVIVSLGNLAREKEDYVLANERYLKAYKLFEDANRPDMMSLVAYNIGDCFLLQEHYVGAEIFYTKSLDYAKLINSPEDIKYGYLGLSKLYKEWGKFEKAYEHRDRYHAIKDSLRELAFESEVSALEVKFEKEETRKELEVAREQLALSNKTLDAEKVLRWILIAGGVILSLLSVLLYVYWRKSRLVNRQLQAKSHSIIIKNKVIDASLKEKELLLKEVHHRVKNNLQMISSLLNLQAKKLRSKSAIQALEESKNRVQAIALIHKSLYQDEQLAEVNLREYITDLVKYQKQLRTSSTLEIKFQEEVCDRSINLDTAVPFGLILSELISNSCKHAFPENHINPLVSIEVRCLGEGKFKLLYSDNGTGMLTNDDELAEKSLGVEIIEALVDQLEGDLKLTSENGTRYQIHFSEQA